MFKDIKVYMEVYDPSWINFCIWSELQIYFSSCFVYDCPNVPEAFVEKNIVSSLNGLCIFVENQLTVLSVGLFFDSSFYSIDIFV